MHLKNFQHSFADSPNLDQFPVLIQSAGSFMQIDLSKVYSITEKDTLPPRAETKRMHLGSRMILDQIKLSGVCKASMRGAIKSL